MVLRALVLTVCLATSAYAGPRYWGIDQLGGAKYKDEIVSTHPDGFALGIFTQKEIFGDGYPVVEEALSKRKIPLVRYNLRWSDSHTFTKDDFPAIVAEATRFVPLVNLYPDVGCQFSGATEHQLNKQDAAELAQLVLSAIPSRCTYVNNPWTGKGALVTSTDRIINEVHGGDAQKPPGKYNFSFDGTDAFESNVTALKARFDDAHVFFMWTSQNNGLADAKDRTPRNDRKFWPSGALMKAMAFLTTDEGSVSLPARYVFKPKSRQSTVPAAPPQLMPVMVIPHNASAVELVANDGSVITKSGPGEIMPDGRYRYFLSEYGFNLAEKALKLQGRPTVSIRVGSEIAGSINPGFRVGDDSAAPSSARNDKG